MDPEIILFDEPTSALDPTMVSEVLDVIRNLANDGMTMVIVTHEMNFARDVSNRVFLMAEGEIYEQGTPNEIFDNPKRELTRMFINRIRSFEYLIKNSNYDYYHLRGQIDSFAKKNYFSQKRTNSLQHVVEETLELIYHSSDNSMTATDNAMTIHVEYGEKKGNITVAFTTKDRLCSILSPGWEDSISGKMLKAMTSDICETKKDDRIILKMELLIA